MPPRNIATVAPPPRESQQASFAPETLITLATSQITPPQAQDQLTTSPQRPRKSKSKDGRGIKQSKNVNTTDTAQVCWRCGEPGHKKRDCHKPPFCGKCRKEGHVPALCPLSTGSTLPSLLQQQVDKFSNLTNRCIHCGGAHVPGSCPVRYQPKATSSTSKYGSPKQSTEDNNVASVQVRSQVTPQVSPLAQVNTLAQSTHSNSFPPPPYFPIPFPPPPVPPSNASIAPSAPASDLSAAISLMTSAVNQGNANTTNITDALQKTTTQFADVLQKTIQRGVEAQAEENRNARLDKEFDKIKIFDGSNPAECHPWLEEVHALCSQTGRPFKEMLLLCAGQAVRDFILDMATTAPQAGTSTPVSTAAKRPAKTQTFLKSLCAALSIFDDEIATLTDVRETAYETFVMAYKAAFTKIWPKIDGADITIILTSVKDTELRQLRRLSKMLCPDKEQPKLVEEE